MKNSWRSQHKRRRKSLLRMTYPEKMLPPLMNNKWFFRRNKRKRKTNTLVLVTKRCNSVSWLGRQKACQLDWQHCYLPHKELLLTPWSCLVPFWSSQQKLCRMASWWIHPKPKVHLLWILRISSEKCSSDDSSVGRSKEFNLQPVFQQMHNE